jgi:tol-pal system protein YbgF
MRAFFPAALATLLLALPVQAQDNAAMNDRLDRLERDLQFLQRQTYNADAAGGSPANASQILVQLGQLQEEMRALRGQVEQVQFANQRQAEEIRKLGEDVEFRLSALEKTQEARSQEEVEAEDESADASTDAEERNDDEEAASEEQDSPASYQPEEEEASGTTTTKQKFPSANAHYSYAFKLMNDRKFSAASESFEAFVKKYPADPLIANAYYWLGESYYVRSEFASAAESFRKGFEADAKSQKAPDNLLKLGMSLGALKQKDQACVVYKQLIRKYGARAPETRTRAQREYGQLGCR